MPGAPRPKGQAKKIAYKVVGVPPNLQNKQSKEQKRINQRLNYEETARVR